MHTLTAALRAAAAAAFHGPPSHPAAAAEEEEEESLLYARVCLASKEGGGKRFTFVPLWPQASKKLATTQHGQKMKQNLPCG